MIFKLESFIKKIRWKAFFYEKSENTPESVVDSFGFKSVRTPPKNEHLNAFESDLYDMVRNIEFKRVSLEFQSNLSKDIKLINEDPLLFIPADKTNNVDKLFMRLIDKHFPRHHKFHKLFNRSNVKLSYSCMPSMKNVIQKHNSKIMEDPKPTNNKACSCRQKSDCPLNENCLSECLVYNAVVNTSTTKIYYGTCEKSFKERYNNHTSSFRNKSRQKSTELSNYIWELKENGENYTIDWLIAMKAHPYICGTRKCDLCLCEKLLIARANSASLLKSDSHLPKKFVLFA